jgi:hypothetical protein
LLVLRFVLDTHVLDAMVADPTLLDAVNKAVVEGRIEVHVTHVQIDEAMATPDEKVNKRSALAQTLANSAAQRSPTYGFVIGMSRLGEAMITGEDFAATYSAEVAAFPSQGNDAILISTAWRMGAKFVTDDKGARATPSRMGMPCCCTIAEFRAEVTRQ